MNSDEYREWGKKMIDYSAKYLETIREREVYPDVKPGYLKHLIPENAPLDPEPFENILEDVDRVIMPGMTHWHHPHFFTYFPTANSYPSILADILSDTLGVIGFSWATSPACTELEMVMMDWLAKAIGLPDYYLSTSESGGGVIHTAASESTLFTLFVARDSHRIKSNSGQNDDSESSATKNVGSMVVYGSKLAHSSVERACLLGAVQYHPVDYDDNYSMRGDLLEKAIEADVEKGLTPFFVVATLGTIACCSFDNLKELGEVCEKWGLWLHVDAAYAGSAFICPETRHLMEGIEMTDSFNFNPHKWLKVQFDCSALWIKDKKKLDTAFHLDPIYLQHSRQEEVVDFRHWQIPLGRRFRSLKLWFVLRSFGVTGLQNWIRGTMDLAEYFASLVEKSEQFELFRPRSMGLVCFRAKGSNDQNRALLKSLNEGREIHLIPAEVDNTYFLRLAICSAETTQKDLDNVFELILRHFQKL